MQKQAGLELDCLKTICGTCCVAASQNANTHLYTRTKVENANAK